MFGVSISSNNMGKMAAYDPILVGGEIDRIPRRHGFLITLKYPFLFLLESAMR